MGRIKSLKAILFLFGFVPLFVTGQNYPRFELYQLKQGTDSGQFIVTGLDSNLAFNNILRFRSADSTFLIGTDTVAVKSDIASSLLGIIDAGLGIEVNEVDGQIVIESLSIEDSIKNQTGTLIEKGTPLYATGVQGNYWTVAPADASDPNKMPVVVIAGEDIADGGTGLGLIKGHIKQVSTVGLADGAEVYVASGGGYTATKPTAEGVIIQRLGTVIKGNSANGSGIINLGDEAYWNDYLESDLTYNYAWVGNVSNEPAEVLATSSSTANTIIRRDANQRFASGFITMDEGINNIGIGSDGFLQNLQTSSGINNIAIGSEAGKTLSTGDYNVFIGAYAGRDETGTGNTFIGNNNSSNSSGVSYSTNIGAGGDGRYNYGVGIGASNNVSTNGTAIGYSSVARSDAVAIGYDAFANSDGIAIGSNVTALTDEIVIGNSDNISLKANNYKFNIDQSVLGKNGFVLTYNASTQEIELDSAGGGGGAVGGIDSVIADQVTILGNGVDDILRVDTTNTIATKQFVLDNSGGSGTSPWTIDGANIYYNSGNVGINNSTPNFKLDVGGDIYSNDDIFVDDELIFGNVADGSVPYIDNIANYMYLSVNASSGTLFNFRDRYYSTNPFIINANNAATILDFNGTSDFAGAMNIEGNLTQSGSIVHDGGSVTFNNTQNGSYDFGVGSLNHLPFMWVDASADKMAVGGGTPQYTLDVSGDINFTGTLYEDGSPFSAGGVTINNNTNNYLLTATGTANTINGESNLTYDGTTLTLLTPMDLNYPVIQLKNASSTNGTIFYLYNTQDFTIKNFESGYMQFINSTGNYLRLKSNGNIEINDLAGVSDIGADANGVLQAATSDTTLKTNIVPNKYGLKKVMDLETIKFNWKDKVSKGSQKEVGFNAQNLQKVIPEATYTIPSNGKLGIKDDAIIATLTKAIQEQQEMIEELQKEIKRIKRKIK